MLNVRTATTRKYISRLDDAVDWKKIGKSKTWARFVEGDIEIDKVPLRPGCKPTVFSLRRLSRAQFIHVMKQPSTLEQSQEACAYGLTAWENFGDAVHEVDDSDLGKRLTEKCLDVILVLAPEVIKELGPVIVGMSMLGPTREQG